MTDPYAPLLMAAIVLSAVATGLALAARFGWRTRPRLGCAAAALAIAMALGALAGHVVLGHRPGSDAALAPVPFVLVHPAPFIVVAIAAVALLLSRY